ncbi:MAG: hypothetical protein MJ252_06900 [archaeon]|nr:hypothetical protein [archaeon]
MESNNSKEFPLYFKNSDPNQKIGKIFNPLDFKNSKIFYDTPKDLIKEIPEKDTKKEEKKRTGLLTLTEIKENNDKINYVGSNYTDQDSKFLLMQFNETKNIFEVVPAEKWMLFQKYVQFDKINLKDAENKMKKRRRDNRYLYTQKGTHGLKDEDKSAQGRKGNKKGKKGRDGNILSSDNEINKSALKGISSDDDIDSFEKREENNSSENDPDLAEEDSFFDKYTEKKKEENESERIINKEMERDVFSENEDDLEDEEDDDDINKEKSEESEEDEDQLDKYEYIGKKRSYEEEPPKRKNVDLEMTEFVVNLLNKNIKMTYEEIAKEVRKKFSVQEIEKYLGEILNKNAKTFNQDESVFYYKK